MASPTGNEAEAGHVCTSGALLGCQAVGGTAVSPQGSSLLCLPPGEAPRPCCHWGLTPLWSSCAFSCSAESEAGRPPEGSCVSPASRLAVLWHCRWLVTTHLSFGGHRASKFHQPWPESPKLLSSPACSTSHKPRLSHFCCDCDALARPQRGSLLAQDAFSISSRLQHRTFTSTFGEPHV